MAYNILPLLLIIAAFSCVNRSRPEFSWILTVTNFDDDPDQYLFTPTATSGLNEEPHMSVSEKDGYGCAVVGEVTYVKNELFTRKVLIEQNVGATKIFLGLVLLTAIIDLLVLAISLLIANRVSLLNTFIFSCLMGIVSIVILMFLGPIIETLYACFVELSLQAELIGISDVGLPYFYISIALAISALVLIIFRYILFHDMLFKPHSQTSTLQ